MADGAGPKIGNNAPARPRACSSSAIPRAGTPPDAEAGQTAGIDLPLKALAWQDDNGDNWLERSTRRGVDRATAMGLGDETAAAVGRRLDPGP